MSTISTSNVKRVEAATFLIQVNLTCITAGFYSWCILLLSIIYCAYYFSVSTVPLVLFLSPLFLTAFMQ